MAHCAGMWSTAAGHGDGDQNTIIVSQIFLDTDPVLYGDCPGLWGVPGSLFLSFRIVMPHQQTLYCSSWHNVFVSSLSSISALHYNLTLLTSYIYQTLRIHGNTAVNSTQIYTKHHTPGDKIQQQNKRRNVSKMLNQMTTARMSQNTISHLLRLASSVLSRLFELYKSPLHQCLTADRNYKTPFCDRLLPTKNVVMIYI